MRHRARIYFFIILAITNAFAADDRSDHCYVKSDLTILSQDSGIIFFNNRDSKIISQLDGTITSEGMYVTAVVYGKQARMEKLHLKKFRKEGPLHYLCLDREEDYQGLDQALNRANTIMIDNSSVELPPAPSLCAEASLESLCSSIQDAQTVCITFGAGISAGYVPTLIECFEALGLEKVASRDIATNESMARCISELVKDREKVLKIAQAVGTKVARRDIAPTPAHHALKSLADFLRKNGKDVFIYTDNIDGIHKRAGIPLSEVYVPEEDIKQILYPPVEAIAQKKVTVLVCGQSFDFHYILSTIYAREKAAQKISFFSLNINPESMAIYEGLDVEACALRNPEDSDNCNFPMENLKMNHIPGSLQETLPALYERMRKAE
ncbi:MAG: Sir2 family [Alphaproteobacteria bacterium]|jgi:hypothetical protein|nr:Sir2 family [Alphaproteobacteria bacterium]